MIVNAQIKYSSLEFSDEFDEITGEPIFTNGASSSIGVSLEETSFNNQISPLPGKDKTQMLLTGRLINPPKLPSWYMVGSELEILFKDGKMGKFYVLQSIKSRFSLEDVFGQSIVGIFYEI